MSEDIDNVKQILIEIMNHPAFPFDYGGCDIKFYNEPANADYAHAFLRCNDLEFWVFHGMNSLAVAIQIDGKIPVMEYRAYEGTLEDPLTPYEASNFIIKSILEGPEKAFGVEEIPLSDVKPRWGFN